MAKRREQWQAAVAQWWRAAALLVGAVLIFLAGGAAGWYAATASGRAVPDSASGVAPLLWQAWNLAQAHYVDPNALQSKKMIYGAIGGMLSTLGDTDHTRFLTPTQVQQENNQLSGHFVGIGVQINLKDGRPVVVAPLPNSPAQRAGLEAGDVIIAVNGTDTAQQTLEQLSSEIRGPAGSRITLQIRRPSTQATFSVTITRAAIAEQSVVSKTFSVNGKRLMDIHVSQFSANADGQMRSALQTAKQQEVDGIILDLRDNPGGLLDQAVDISSQFLGSGNVLLRAGRNGVKQPVPAKSDGLATETPLVVLVNQGTASAAEITAGALKDQKRGPLVGTTTFGTGTVLSTYSLSDGSEVLLGTEEWLTPDGNLIWHHGISPTQPVTLPANATPLFPNAADHMSGDQIAHSNDTQLDQAIKDLAP